MMNEYQKNYAAAKALVGLIEGERDDVERKYIQDNGIVNPDGTIPDLIYCIEDEAVFEKANKECSDMDAESGLQAELNEARAQRKAAEDDLIAYGLSIAPADIRNGLALPARTNAAIRYKMIDTLMRLDVDTVR